MSDLAKILGGLVIIILSLISLSLLLTAGVIVGINWGLSEWIPQVPKISCVQAFWVSVLIIIFSPVTAGVVDRTDKNEL